MLQDKHSDLLAEKRKRVLERLVMALSREGLDLYYSPTAQVAASILAQVESGARLNGEERDVMRGLTQRDIEILLSLKS